jgi:hypothetical protein
MQSRVHCTHSTFPSPTHMRHFSLTAVLLFVATVALPAQTAAPAPAPIDFSGSIFGNFQYRTDSAAKAQLGGKNPNKFDIERVYLTFRMPAGEHASIRVTTDIFQNAAPGAYYGGWAVRLKYGYLQYNFTNALAGVKDLALFARVGMLHTVVVDHEEQFFPRWLGRAATEQNGFFSSADMGVASQLTLPGRRGEVYATITNGPGYTAAETDRFKDVAARFSWTPFGRDSGLARTFTVSPWFYKGSTQSAVPLTFTDGLRRDRYGIFTGVRDHKLSAGAQWSRRIETLETLLPTRTTADRTGQLVSAFAIARPTEWASGKRSPFGIVARYDNFKPSTAADPNNRFIILGALWDFTSRASVALDYQAQTFADYPNAGPADIRTLFLHWQTTF